MRRRQFLRRGVPAIAATALVGCATPETTPAGAQIGVLRVVNRDTRPHGVVVEVVRDGDRVHRDLYILDKPQTRSVTVDASWSPARAPLRVRARPVEGEWSEWAFRERTCLAVELAFEPRGLSLSATRTARACRGEHTLGDA